MIRAASISTQGHKRNMHSMGSPWMALQLTASRVSGSRKIMGSRTEEKVDHSLLHSRIHISE
jgi:hypothetical protein